MDIAPIIAAGAGAAIAREVICGYFERKRSRTEIKMVRDRKGRFVDSAKVFERKAFYGYLATIAALTIVANVILLT